jgi:DNA-binding transcriptional LysR family regulator
VELRHLRYFRVLAEELHFTRAAERLHIGQPPLSLQIRALEEELGVTLFERTRRHVALTEAGKRLLIGCQRIFNETEHAVEETKRAARGEIGELRIGYSASLPFTSLLPKVLHDYRERHPHIKLMLSSLFSAEQFDALLAQRLDIGLLRDTGGAVPNGIELHEVSRDALRAVIHTGHPLAKRKSISLIELKNDDFIAYPQDLGERFNVQERQLCLTAGFEPNVVQEAREATTQIGLVAAGFGVALLPQPMECVHIAGVCYLPLKDPRAYVRLAIATRQGHNSSLVHDFLEVLLPESRRPYRIV